MLSALANPVPTVSMSPIRLTFLALALASASASSADLRSNIDGTYVSAPKKICFVGPPSRSGKMTETDCSIQRDEIKIQKASRRYSVELSFMFFNGHTCEFSGIGDLHGSDLVAVDPDNTACPLTLSCQGASVELKQSDECRSYYCGARGSINGSVLNRKPE